MLRKSKEMFIRNRKSFLEERHENFSSKNEKLLTELEAVVIEYITKFELLDNSKRVFAIYDSN